MDTARAWKDAEYRMSLSAVERAKLPVNPVGAVELGDADLAELGGGTTSAPCGATPVATAAAGCFTLGNTVCNGTCAAGGTQGCCH